MADSATIVAASLDSSQLEQSINKLVATVASKTKEMADNFTKEVGRMEQAVKNLGNIKVGSGGTADGGSSRRTSKQKEEETQIKATTQAYKEQSVSLDQLASAQQKAIRLPSEMRMPDVAKSARESFQAFYKGFNEQARQIEPLIQSWEKLLQARHTGNIEQVAQKIAQVKHEIAELVKEQANLSKTKPQGYLDEIAKRNPQIKALREQLISLETEHQKLKASDPFKDNPYLNTLREKLQGVKSAMNDADTTSRRLLFTTKELTEEQKKLAEASLQKSLSHAMKIPTNEIDLARVKLESLQGLLIQMGERGLLSNSQKFKINEEIQRLVNFIADADSKQSSLISGSKRYTEEIRKQAEAIKSIDNQNKAKSAFASVTQMDANNIEQLRLKLNNLLELKNKVAGTPLLSKSNLNMLDWMIGDVKRKISEIGTVQNQASNQQKKTLDDMNAYIRQNIQREQERREAIRQTGLAAQDAFAKIRQNAQIQLAENTDKPIKGIKELADAITNMRRLYFDMSTAEKESPLGLALKRDIENAQKLKIAIDAYNRTLKGMSVFSTNNNANSSLGAYTELTNILKTLSDEYKRLGREERNAAKGNDLADKIQRLSRATQKIQQQMNRPISFAAAMKGSEKTLDDIAYKMQRLRAYKQGIDLTKPNAANEIRQVDEALVRLRKDMDKYLSKSKDVLNSNNALGRSWNYMKNRLAFYFTVGASTQFIKNLIEVRSQYEMNERALGILINSAERGTQIFNELSQMALVSPYTLIELSTAAKQLTAYDVAAKDVVDTTRRLADMAAAVGIPIERLTYALGQIKAYGYLNSRDARMFANAGIPLVKQLADYYTELEGKLVSTADIYDRIKKKAIGYNDVMSVMYKMTDEGGKFFDFQAKMADTLKVRLANLTLAWNNMLNDMGKESQGVLTWGIGALRELFLQWRTFDKTLKEAAGAFGLYKAIQLIILGLQTATKSTLGLNARLTATGVLGTRLVTIFKTLGGTMKALAANWWLVLVAAAVELSSAIINANEATKEFNKSMREGAESTANDLKKYIEQYKEVRDSLYKKEILHHDNGKTGYRIVPQDIDKNEASKAWEVMREQIELSSAASNNFVSRLLQIENVSDRLREGFKIIDDIQQVNAALKDMGDEALVVTQKWSAWWNAWQAPDGLFTNLKEFKVELDEIRQKYGDIANARYVAEHGDINRAANEQDAIMRAASEAVNDYDREMNRFRADLDKYTSSLDNFANAMEFSSNPTQVAELYAKAVKQLVTQGQLNPQEAFDLQLQIEEARTNAMKLALQSRIADEESALKLAQDKRTKESLNASIENNKAQLKLFENSTYEQTAYWNDFTKYIKERHISELTAAYNSMTDHGKKAMDFQTKDWQKYVHDWANGYEKSHNLKIDSVFNRLRNWINDANTWSVFIKMTISTEDGKSVYKQLEEYDKAADDAWKTMQRLDKRISQLRKKGAKEVEVAETGVIDLNRVSQDDRELTEALKERTQAQKDYNEAIEKGGESKKENSAASKAQKQAESELAKALKDELKLIETVRNSYKDLTKEGASHADAIEKSVSGYEKSVANINAVLNKYGIGLDLSKFAGISNPHELQKMLQNQLNALLGKAKPAEIQALEVELKKVDLDVEKYDLTKITKGLNNELDRLKEEYELAVSLDADPELGGIFADMFDLHTDQLPHTISEYAQRVTTELNKAIKDRGDSIQLPTIYLTKDDIDAFRKMSEDGKLNTKSFEDIQKAYQDFVSLRKKAATDVSKIASDYIREYGDLSAQIQQIEIDKNDALMKLNEIYNTDALRQTQRYLDAKFAIEDGAKRKQAKATFDALKKESDYERFFTAIDTLTEKDALSIKNKIKKGIIDSFKNGGLTASQFRKEIKALEEQFDKLSQPTSNWISYLSGGFDKLIQRAKETGQEIETIGEKISITGKVDENDKNYLQSLGSIFNNGKGGNTDFSSLMSLFGKDMKGLGSNISKAGQGMQAGASGFAGAVTIVDAIIKNVHQTVQAIGSVIDELDSVRNEENKISNAYWEGFKKFDNYATSGWENLKSGNVAGAIADTANSIISIFNTFSNAKNEKINKEIKESERAIKRLELAYIDLEQAVEKAYGMATIGANMAAKANKELQLEELKRQLTLERSRDSKRRDEDKIVELKKQIKELEYDIADTVDSIVNDLLGISSVGDALENVMGNIIEAFRSGSYKLKDIMKDVKISFNDMIANMVMKMYTTKVLQPWFEEQWNTVQNQINERAGDIPDKLAEMQSKTSIAKNADTTNNDSLVEALRALGMSDDQIHLLNWYDEFGQLDRGGRNARLKAAYEKALKEAEQKEAEIQKELATATMPTTDDIKQYAELLRNGQPIVTDRLKEIESFLRELGLLNDKKETTLSALQAGISGVTEDTAGALEAYMNGVSQQVYYHSSLLEQIRDSVVGLDLDVSLGVQSQMLLQLQNSYQTQQAIQQILEGVLVPSGRAFAVELLS